MWLSSAAPYSLLVRSCPCFMLAGVLKSWFVIKIKMTIKTDAILVLDFICDSDMITMMMILI